MLCVRLGLRREAKMETIGIAIFLAVIIVVDYLVWTRGDSNSLFFKDKTDLEKDIRKLQHLEVIKRIREIEASGVCLSDNKATKKP